MLRVLPRRRRCGSALHHARRLEGLRPRQHRGGRRRLGHRRFAARAERDEYLRSLEKNYRKDGVWIDDPKGLFIFRWYREVKVDDGSPVTGQRYQNPQTAAYQLTLNNDGDPFVWDK